MIVKQGLSSFRTILIYGAGMMGTSLALAIRAKNPHARIWAIVRSKQSAQKLEALKITERILLSGSSEINNIPYELYDMVVLAVPVDVSLSLARQLPHMRGLITDLSSTQEALCKAFQARTDLRFVASHPLCGSEKSGPGAAIKNLFDKRLCLIASSPKRKKDVEILAAFWEAIGMYTCQVTPKQHDEAMAYLSHVPHLLAGLLCHWIQENMSLPTWKRRAPVLPIGGGFQDMSRLASSNPEMLLGILETNKENILSALQSFSQGASALSKALEQENSSFWYSWFKKTNKLRSQICSPS